VIASRPIDLDVLCNVFEQSRVTAWSGGAAAAEVKHGKGFVEPLPEAVVPGRRASHCSWVEKIWRLQLR
jgi:hypothetical protein